MSLIKIARWNYRQIQINAQRITTNESFKMSVEADQNPTEVFVRIPFNMYEDNLIPLFEIVGVVAQLRLMMDHSGRNRGFGYIIFVDSEDAHRAVSNLNNVLVSASRRLSLIINQKIGILWLGFVSDEFDVSDFVDLILGKVDPEEVVRKYIFRVNWNKDVAR